MEELIEVGKVVSTQGNRGALRVLPLLEQLEEYALMDEVCLVHDEHGEKSFEVANLRAQGRILILQLCGCDSLEAARGLVGATVKISRRKLKELPQNHYYWFETDGLEVYEENGLYWGKVVEAFSAGSNDVYVVRNGEKEILLPAIREVIQKIDLTRRRMTIRLLEGLVEEEGDGV